MIFRGQDLELIEMQLGEGVIKVDIRYLSRVTMGR